MAALNTDDGITLHRVSPGQDGWPAPAAARGTVLIVHGLGEHIGRYRHVATALAEAGWSCEGYDHRGHGRSTGPRGGVAREDSLLTDLGAVLAAVRGAHPGPLVLLGHSMGGAVVGRYGAEGLADRPAPWWQPVDALVMSSPALDLGMNGLQKLLLAVMGGLAPDLAVGNGLKPEWVCRDPAVVKAYVGDPLVHDRVTARLVRFMLEAGRTARDRAPRWDVPTLLSYAGADRCVAPAGSAAFADAAPAACVTTRRWDGFAHEIFNEPEQAQVLADLTRWLAAVGSH